MRFAHYACIFLGGSLLAAQTGAKPPVLPKGGKEEKPAVKVVPVQPNPPRPVPAPAPAAESPAPSRTLVYGEKDVATLKTKLRYTTLIILPKQEQILDVTCGDRDLWVINGAQNMAYVKPAKPGARTNINLIAASGNIYSFLLSEVSEDPKAEPDLKVFVEPKDDSFLSAAAAGPRFYSAQQMDEYRQQVESAKDEVRRAKASAQSVIDQGISSFVENVRFPYRFEAGKKPFYVRAMYTDGKFTYIRARPEETPALYELKDGKPNLVNFQYKNGIYVVGKVLDRGYLVVGKQKLAFSTQE